MNQRRHKDYARKRSKLIFKREDILVFFVLTLIFMLQLMYTIMLNRSSLKGIELDEINTQIAEYKLRNELLREDVLQHRSLGTIKEEAQQAGFHEVTKSDYAYIK